MPYFKYRDELHLIDNLIFKSNQLIIPHALRKEILNKIHEGHLGVQRTQGLAKNLIYWPNINQHIENLILNCDICIRYRNKNQKQPLMSHEIDNIPWHKVGIDLFDFNNKKYILVVDYFSKYIEVETLNSGYSSKNAIGKLKSIFARHGIPNLMISDNGPPFNSIEFKIFCQEWEITHITSSPYMSRSNGLVERSIQTIKKLFKKCLDSNSDPFIALLHYRTTPKGNFGSPSQLLMSRTLKTKIPTLTKNLKPKVINYKKYSENIEKHKNKTKLYYDQDAKALVPLERGEKFFFKRDLSSHWYPGEVIDKSKEPRSYIINDENGNNYRRNREHLLNVPPPDNSDYSTSQAFGDNQNDIINENENSSPKKLNIKELRTRYGRKIVEPSRLGTTKQK